MLTIFGAENYQQAGEKLYLALGNFDGLHLAHRLIVRRTCMLAQQAGGKSAVFLFDPHPVTKLYPDKNILLLSSVKMRSGSLAQLGIDYLIVEEFNDSVASLSPYRFVADYLVRNLAVTGVVIGFDYTFGKGGRGTPVHLLKWGEQFNFTVEVVPPVIIGNEVVSSSLIRELLAKGEVREAAKYLGEYFKISGKVVGGEERGRVLGFPTANIYVQEGLLLPAAGVYLCSVAFNGNRYFALTYIGNKPTFHKNFNVVLEASLLDFAGNLYGAELNVAFLHRIRKEIVFAGANSLVEQIKKDEKKARELIRRDFANLADNVCS